MYRAFEDESNTHGCCGRNKLSICLAIVVMILILIISFGVFFIVINVDFGKTEEQEECTNAACIKFSALINEFIDDSVDPCNDFYSFVCGKFEKSAYEKRINNLMTAENERITRSLNALIVEPVSKGDPHLVMTQKRYFQACLNEKRIDENNDRSLHRKLTEIGLWPGKYNESTFMHQYNYFDWVDIMIKTKKMALPFEWFLKVDLHGDTDYMLKLTVPDDCTTNTTLEYFDMQHDILENLMVLRTDTLNELTELRKFEKTLHLICVNASNERTVLTTIQSLNIGNINMLQFLRDITGTYKWRSNSIIAVNLVYLRELTQFLQNNQRAQSTYVLWKIIEYFAPYSTKNIRERYTEYLNQVSEEPFSRFEFCLNDTKSKFKYVSEIAQIQNYIDSSIEENGKEIVDNLKDEIVNFIDNAEWKHNKTQHSCLNFFQNMKRVIGGTDEMFESNFLAEHVHVGKLAPYYADVIEIIFDWRENMLSSKMALIGKSSTENLNLIFEANSQFSIDLDYAEQSLIVPASAFKSLLYNTDLPNYLNYAGLGILIQKKLVGGLHMLANTESEYYKSFEDNKKCLVKSIQKFDRSLTGEVMFMINYDSFLAQELAYKAYQTYLEDNEEDEMSIINLSYSPNQLFWIRSSLTSCYHSFSDEEEDSSELHKIYKYRILEGVRHSQFFASDFNCSEGTLMNPKKKCLLS